MRSATTSARRSPAGFPARPLAFFCAAGFPARSPALFCATGLALLVSACAPGDAETPEAESPDAASPATTPAQQVPAREYVGARSPADGDDVLPFSGAVWVGHTLYLSGALGLENGQVPATAEAEAANVMNNVKATLESAGLAMDDLVSVQVFASDVGDYQAFNSVYRTYFTTEYPARAFIGAGTLLFGARFEVQGIAARR